MLIRVRRFVFQCRVDEPGVRDAVTETVLIYPDSPRGEQVDDYHGTTVADPYRWLEALEAEQTTDWVAAQNELTMPLLKAWASPLLLVCRTT